MKKVCYVLCLAGMFCNAQAAILMPGFFETLSGCWSTIKSDITCQLSARLHTMAMQNSADFEQTVPLGRTSGHLSTQPAINKIPYIPNDVVFQDNFEEEESSESKKRKKNFLIFKTPKPVEVSSPSAESKTKEKKSIVTPTTPIKLKTKKKKLAVTFQEPIDETEPTASDVSATLTFDKKPIKLKARKKKPAVTFQEPKDETQFVTPYVPARLSLEEREKYSWFVERPYIIENNRNNNFSLGIARLLYGKLENDCRMKRAEICETMKRTFYTPSCNPENGIPLRTHRIWITSKEFPTEASKERLAIYLKSLTKLKSKAWDHHFWCMKKDGIPETIKALQSSEIPITIHEVEELVPNMKVKYLFDAYYDDKQFCLASDILRQEIVYTYGGLYSDLGTDFLTDLEPFLNTYDYIFWYNGIFLDQTFFGFKKHDPIAKNFLDNLGNLHAMPDTVKSLANEQDWKAQIWGSGAHYMALFDAFSAPTDRLLLVPEHPKSLIQINHARTWWYDSQERCGNKPLYESTLNIMELKPTV
ncbi:hypothetical protein [Candidatus Finniella inopinata]|uniref:GT44 domain-containing protein n=1 Tax=Candidatus Finniella inopinata TaxID=1696036 RepID=A0A4Q7DL94_9PROT|nr:hypothetical protein [Candidatus Finniella inopinata]RZI47119.1 hypothetical protein EQU50_00620 [Candidatus Finniella inopinata]